MEEVVALFSGATLSDPNFNEYGIFIRLEGSTPVWKEKLMGIKFEGQVLKFGTVDKCNRKFAPDCKITFPEKIPVAYNFDMD